MATLYSVNQIQYGYTWGKQSVEVLRGVSFDIPNNAFACIVGPSGSGKTTMLNLMGFLDRPQAGQLTFSGVETQTFSESKYEKIRLTDLGFIFQSFHLIPTLTVSENTGHFLPLLGVKGKQAQQRVEEILTIVGLIDHRDKMPDQLSGGQRQRVAIARALAKKPKVILADEPTANLDRETAESIIQAFKSLHESKKASFIFSTHDPHLVSYAHQIYQLEDGVIKNIKGV